jgi:hypothetical protein
MITPDQRAQLKQIQEHHRALRTDFDSARHAGADPRQVRVAELLLAEAVRAVMNLIKGNPTNERP